MGEYFADSELTCLGANPFSDREKVAACAEAQKDWGRMRRAEARSARVRPKGRPAPLIRPFGAPTPYERRKMGLSSICQAKQTSRCPHG